MTEEDRMALAIARGYMRGIVSSDDLDTIRWHRRAVPDAAAQDVLEGSGVMAARTLAGLLAEIEGESPAAGNGAPELAATAFDLAAASAETPEGRPVAAIPDRVGNYRVTGHIGSGGMGVVLSAVDESLQRTVAIKLIRADWSENQKAAARFEREVRAVGQLQHENIVRILEVGRHQGLPYLVMELLAGEGLDQIQRASSPGNMVPERAARLCMGIARGLAHAHARGIIHRDVKPSNVLVTPGEEGERPVLIDFGLARQVDSHTLTLTREVLGTPVYMSPEQATGHPDQIGPRCDVYSLGATLYELVTGRTVHQGGTPLELLHKIRTQDPVPPRQLRPDLPQDLEVITLKCLEKEPQRRYASAAAVAADLQSFLQGAPISARPVGALGRALRTARRHRAVTSVAVLAVVLLSTLGAVSIASKLRDIEALDLSRREEKRARERAQDRAEAQDRVLQALRLVEIGSAPAQVLAAFDSAEVTDPSYHGVFQQRGRYLLGLGRIADAVEQLRAAVLRKRGDALALFYLYQAFERDGRAEGELRELLDQLRNLQGGGELTLWAEGLHSFDAAMATLDPDRRRELLNDARRSFDAMVTLAPRLATGYVARGETLSALGEPRLAREDALRAVELAPDDPKAHLLIARVYAVFEMHDEALAACDRALYLDPDLTLAYQVRAEIELDRGWIRHARQDAGRVVASGRATSRGLALALAIERAAGDDPGAVRETMAEGVRALGDDPRFLAEKALAHVELGEVQEGRSSARQLCEIAPHWPQGWRVLALALASGGDASADLPAAVEAADRACELTAAWRGLGDREGSWSESLCLVSRAELASRLGDDELAVELCGRAHAVGYHANDHHYLEAILHARAGRCDDARVELDRIAASPSQRIGFWLASAAVAEACRGPEATVAILARGLGDCPGSGALREELARLAPGHALLEPPAPGEVIEAARAAAASGEEGRAAELAGSLVAQAPELATAHLLVGDLAAAAGDQAAARDAYGRALARDPHLVAAYDGRARARWSLGEEEDAITDLDRALAQEWTPGLLNQRALMHKRLGRWARALADYDAAIELDPREAKLYQNRANALVNLGEPERALASYDRSLELDPERWRARLGRGLCHYSLENLAEAEADIQLFLDEFPDYRQRADLERTLDDIRRKLSQPGR